MPFLTLKFYQTRQIGWLGKKVTQAMSILNKKNLRVRFVEKIEKWEDKK